MDYQQVISEVNEIFIDVLEDDDIQIGDATTVDDIEDWDSLNNMQIVIAIEKHFNIRFKTGEIVSFENVGAMCRNIVDKLGE